MANPDDLELLKKDVKAWNAWRKENPRHRPDLSGTDLAGAKLSGANLSRVNLSSANLSRTKLPRANLSGSDLTGSDLTGTNLAGANLRAARLIGTNLSEANLAGANLSGTNLSGANLFDASFSGANLSKATNLDLATPSELVETLLRIQARQEEEARSVPTETTRQTILTTTPLADGGYSLSSLFLRLPPEVTSRNEPVLTDALAAMEGVHIVVERVASFEEMAAHMTPKGVNKGTFSASLRKALAEECAVIAIRNPPFDLGKDLVDKAFTGGTIFTAITHAPDPQTFVYFVAMAGAGFVTLRICKSLTDGADIIIRAKANQIADRMRAPPKEQDETKSDKKPKKKK